MIVVELELIVEVIPVRPAQNRQQNSSRNPERNRKRQLYRGVVVIWFCRLVYLFGHSAERYKRVRSMESGGVRSECERFLPDSALTTLYSIFPNPPCITFFFAS